MSSPRPPSRKGLSRLELEMLATIEGHHMLRPGERVAVACSGGADSTALLLGMISLSRRFGWVVSVAHYDHQLRGAESDADARFVRELAETNFLTLLESRSEVRTHARNERANLEATARKLRYQFLRSLVASGQVDRVAVGHTADDQAETVLMRLIRGAGPQGLAAIQPTLPGGIIRPLITVRGKDLRAWLHKRGVVWREDSSNQDLRLRRNLVRHELLPSLVKINPSIVKNLAHTAALAQADDAFWKGYVQHLSRKYSRRERGDILIDLPALRRLPTAAGLRLVKMKMEELSWEHRRHPSASPSYDQVRSLYEWARSSGTEKHRGPERPPTLRLPGNIAARRNSKHLILSGTSRRAQAGRAARSLAFQYAISAPGEIAIPQVGLRFRLELIPVIGGAAAYNGEEKVLMDGAALEFPLLLRSWRAGDAMRPAGRHKFRKLKDLFQRNQIPAAQRSVWPVLESQGRIVWSWRFGPAEGFAASPSATMALQITISQSTASNVMEPAQERNRQ